MSTIEVSDGLFASGPPMRSHRLLGLARRAEARARRALVIATVGWVPVFLLASLGSALSWSSGFDSFVSDVAFHSRALVAAPLLILAETVCGVRLAFIARLFIDSGLVSEDERPQFDAAVSSTLRLRDSLLAEIVVVLLAFAAVFAIVSATGEMPRWRRPGNGPLPYFSPAAWWELLVTFPILLALIFGWFWRIFLWARFLWLVSKLDLKLVYTHPDSCAGLGFVAFSVRAFSVVAGAFGVIVAGSAAEAVIHHGHSVYEFRATVLALVVFVLALCCAPPFVFTKMLLAAWRRGVIQYGAKAALLGREFERTFLAERGSDTASDNAPDVSTTNDLFQLAERVYDIKFLPLDVKGLGFLVIVMLVPFAPVVFFALPFDVILARLKEILL